MPPVAPMAEKAAEADDRLVALAVLEAGHHGKIVRVA